MQKRAAISGQLVGLSLFAMAALALLLLPASEPTLAPDARLVTSALFLLGLVFCALCLIKRVCDRFLPDPILATLVYLTAIVAVLVVSGAVQAMAWLVFALGVLGIFSLLRPYRADSPTAVIAFTAVILVLLIMFPVSFISVQLTTGDFFLRSLAVPQKWDDWFYHYTLVASILKNGIASTGLDGVISDPYHIGGHYLLAGVYRLLNIPVETSPVSLGMASTYVLMLAFLMLSIQALVRSDSQTFGTINSAAAALLAGLIYLGFERSLSAAMPAWTRHLGILNSGAALPAAGVIYVYGMLAAARPGRVAVSHVAFLLPLLLFACMSKISTGLIAYSVLGAVLGFRVLLDRKELPAAACWIIGGAIVVYISYSYVAVLAGERTAHFDLDNSLALIARAGGWILASGYLCLASLALWLCWFWITGRFHLLTIIVAAGAHLTGMAACLFVLASGAVTYGTDVVYFFISLLQVNFFSLVFASALIAASVVASWRSRIDTLAFDWRVAAPVGAVSALLIILGIQNVRTTTQRHSADARAQICNLIGKARCEAIGPAGVEVLINEVGRQSVIAQVVAKVRRTVAQKDEQFVLLIDKRSGFFEWQGKSKNTLKVSGCYAGGWAVFAATGVPLRWAVPEGSAEDQLCRTPSLSQELLWKRYGYGSYLGRDAGARSFDSASLQQACADLPGMTILYLRPDRRLQRVNCSGQQA